MNVLLMAVIFSSFFTNSDKGSQYESPAFKIVEAKVTFHSTLDLLVFSQRVKGSAGTKVPKANGQLNGAPVLGYVFPTNLSPEDVGFRDVEGIVALAVTSHPDFDDTPLWDEDNDGNYKNDGPIFHTHWVVLGPDKRVSGGLAAKSLPAEEISRSLPPTNPGMPMYLDSPGFSVLFQGDTLKVLVPAQRVNNKTEFQFDAVTAYMEVATEGDKPMLGVYRVFSVLSGDLSLPYRVEEK